MEGCAGTSEVSASPHAVAEAFPVPFDDRIFLGTPSLALSTYRMFDLRGELIQQGRVEGDASILGLGGLPSGFYLLKAGDATFKVVK